MYMYISPYIDRYVYTCNAYLLSPIIWTNQIIAKIVWRLDNLKWATFNFSFDGAHISSQLLTLANVGGMSRLMKDSKKKNFTWIIWKMSIFKQIVNTLASHFWAYKVPPRTFSLICAHVHNVSWQSVTA